MKKTLLTLTLLGFSFSVHAGEVSVGTDKRTNLSVAIYNQDLALVNDTRMTSLAKGLNDIAFLDVSASIRAETALVKGSGFYVKEQNFNYDLLTYTSLLEKSLGQDVTLEYINPGNGDKIVEKGQIISNAGGMPVLKIGDRIDANYPGRIIFNTVPKSLRSKPTLTLALMANTAVKTSVGLSYLTRGLSWKADYVAEMNKDETEISINGLVTLNNTSGVSYENAKLQLVAGNVNQVQPMMMKSMRSNEMMMESAFADTGAGMAQESFMDYHLYTMSGTVDIMDNQTKQVSLLNGKAKVEKEYTYRNLFSIYNGNSYGSNFKARKPDVSIKFENSKEQGLGMPMPAGVLRVYKPDSKGALLFAGEDRINHTPKNEEVEIKLGEAFDITAKGKRVSFKNYGSKTYEAEYELILKNAKDTSENVNIFQYIPNGTKILSENHKSVVENSNEIKWNVLISANGEKTLKFKVRVVSE